MLLHLRSVKAKTTLACARLRSPCPAAERLRQQLTYLNFHTPFGCLAAARFAAFVNVLISNRF
jgi:hypothetical protein